jgi:four helix bundle protein
MDAKTSGTMDIYERAFRLAAGVVTFVGTLPRNVAGYQIGKQLIRSGTSVGANLEEANGAESRRDFIHKAAIARKEARESQYWLRICSETALGDAIQCQTLTRECDEIRRILSAIIRNTEANAEGKPRL